MLYNNIAPVNNSCRMHYNMKDTDQEKWEKVLEDNLKLFKAPLNVIMNTDCKISTDNLERAATALTMAISQTNEKAAKVQNPSPAVKPWWNSDLMRAAAHTCHLRNLQLEC
ncbi:hypothetical protein P691DRAFT_764504 [Macrolepiota fuliginosa MF-IS2]|uniref:Uncharacterized protein n=1 Tax=Macrolepiota fuliginosa MF-IS2 TaxID=1400762 RepID=A0A9P5X4E2_9AGAR|nr:hypothetical protein P691DRAFT_764504 [Macrolepiota fuliginosa MF-IS2]